MSRANTNTWNAALTPNDTPAAAMPSRTRMKFITSPMSIKLVINPMMSATTRALTVTFPPVSQTKLLEATNALASVRPATTIRNNPAARVRNATPDDWTSAARTCSAIAPVMLTSSVAVSGST